MYTLVLAARSSWQGRSGEGVVLAQCVVGTERGLVQGKRHHVSHRVFHQ